MLVDSLLLFLLGVKVSQFVLKSTESVHHYLQSLAQLGSLVAHHFHAILRGVTGEGHLFNLVL